MPPKKKARILSRAASTPSQVAQPTIEASETTATPNKPTVEEANEELLKDPWTDEEETALFKAMIRWKPVGMHKHFRMIAISEHLQRNGHHPKTSPHTRIPGIWKKLNMLYNLEALDEREDSYPEGSPDDSYTAADFFHPFELPEAEFGRLMFERRLAREPSSSPPYDMDTPIRESTVADTEDSASSRPPSRGDTGKGTRRSTRRSLLQHEATRKSSKESSRAGSTIDGDVSMRDSSETEEGDGEEHENSRTTRHTGRTARGRGRGGGGRRGRKR